MDNQEESKEKVVPSYLSIEWHDHVMSHFHPSELIDGNPTTAGLRRVAEILLGDIVDSGPKFVSPVQGDRAGRATVTYSVTFVNWRQESILSVNSDTNAGQRVYADVADVWEGNTEDMFYVHAVATASTRAEGRALRKALKLRCIAAEEVCKKDASRIITEGTTAIERITQDQINFMANKCRKLDMNLAMFINTGKSGKKYNSIHEITRETAQEMIKTLGGFTKKEDVPKELSGYNEDWNN